MQTLLAVWNRSSTLVITEKSTALRNLYGLTSLRYGLEACFYQSIDLLSETHQLSC
jgi:hypothetical protein